MPNRRDLCSLISMLLLYVVSCSFAAEQPSDVFDYKAWADGKRLCTSVIQEAIDAQAANGGGTVTLPAGTFLSGTLYLKNGVTLHLAAGCTLLGSKTLKDYPVNVPKYRSYTDNYTERSLIYAEGAERIAITGRGVIDGQGAAFKGPYKVRPYMIRFVECRDVQIEDVTVLNSPMWVQHYLACDDVHISGITVKSHVNYNNDGIDIDSCHRVVITGCNIDSGDDAIVLKSTSDRICRHVTVTGCVLRSTCNAFKMGTESNGGFENIVMSGCVVHDTRLAGVALEIVDGGVMDGVVVSDLTMRDVGAPLFVRLGNRARPFKENMATPGVGRLRNVTICNVESTGANPTGCAISGLPEAQIENLTLRDIRLSFAGGGTRAQAAHAVPEHSDKYPEYSMFGQLPAYGLYCRHVRGLRLANVELKMEKEDGRHAVVFEDVQHAVVDGLMPACSDKAAAQIRLDDARDVLVVGCMPPRGTGVFLQVQGPNTKRITLMNNDFGDVEKVVEADEDVSPAAVVEMANRID